MASKVKALQMWCRARTEGYPGVNVCDMTSSWKSGLAFCALIHRYRPDLIDFENLSKENIYENNKLAFDVAEEKLGIPSLLDAEDMVRMVEPDKFSVVTYVAQLYHYFQDKKPEGLPPSGLAKSREDSAAGGPPAEQQRPDDSRRPSSLVFADKDKQDSAAVVRRSMSTVEACAACGERVFAAHRRMDAAGRLHHAACLERSVSSPSIRRSWVRESPVASTPVNGQTQSPMMPPAGGALRSSGLSKPACSESPASASSPPEVAAAGSRLRQLQQGASSELGTRSGDSTGGSSAAAAAAVPMPSPRGSGPSVAAPLATPRGSGPSAAAPVATPRAFAGPTRPQPASRQASMPIISRSLLPSPSGGSDDRPSSPSTFSAVAVASTPSPQQQTPSSSGAGLVDAAAAAQPSAASMSDELRRPRVATVMRSKSDAVRNLSSVLRRSIAGDRRDMGGCAKQLWRPSSYTSLSGSGETVDSADGGSGGDGPKPIEDRAASQLIRPAGDLTSALKAVPPMSEPLVAQPAATSSSRLTPDAGAADSPAHTLNCGSAVPVLFDLSDGSPPLAVESSAQTGCPDAASDDGEADDTASAALSSHRRTGHSSSDSKTAEDVAGDGVDNGETLEASSRRSPEAGGTSDVTPSTLPLQSVAETCELCQDSAPQRSCSSDDNGSSSSSSSSVDDLAIGNRQEGLTVGGGRGSEREKVAADGSAADNVVPRAVTVRFSAAGLAECKTASSGVSTVNFTTPGPGDGSSGVATVAAASQDSAPWPAESAQPLATLSSAASAALTAGRSGWSCRDLTTIQEATMEQNENEFSVESPRSSESPRPNSEAVAACSTADAAERAANAVQEQRESSEEPQVHQQQQLLPKLNKTPTETLLEEVLAASNHGEMADAEGEVQPVAAKVEAELGRIDKELRGLEAQSQRLAKEMQPNGSEYGSNSQLVDKLLETVNRKNLLLRRESELICLSKQCALETRQLEIDVQLRHFLEKPDNLKTDEEKRHEARLLEEKVQLVEERHKLVMSLDDERLRKKRTLDCFLCSHHATEATLINSR